MARLFPVEGGQHNMAWTYLGEVNAAVPRSSTRIPSSISLIYYRRDFVLDSVPYSSELDSRSRTLLGIGGKAFEVNINFWRSS
jgi:hypothetical protein